MLYSKKLFFLFFLISCIALSQEKITLSGTVYDDLNNETLIGVSIYFPGLEAGTSTNEYGFYSITIPNGNYNLQISYLGYNTLLESISLSQKTTKNFNLKETSENLDEIIIESNIYNSRLNSLIYSVNNNSKMIIKIEKYKYRQRNTNY